jgi:hypothetical protein
MSTNGDCPRVGVPPFIVIGFSIVNHAFLGTPMKIPKYYNPRLSRKIPGVPARARGSCAQRPFQRFPWRSENAIGAQGGHAVIILGFCVYTCICICECICECICVCIYIIIYIYTVYIYMYVCSWYTQMGGAHHFLTVSTIILIYINIYNFYSFSAISLFLKSNVYTNRDNS